MPSEWVTVPSFGGGLNFNAQPQSIADNEWSWCNGFYPDEQGAIPLPLYLQVIPATFFSGKAPAQTPFGVLMNPFLPAKPILLLTYETAASDPAPVHLYTSDGTPAGTTEVAWDGVGQRPTRYHAHRTAPQAAFLDGWLVITCGSGDIGFSMLRWNGTAAWSTLVVGSTFRCAHLESFGEHLIGAAWGTSQADMRRVKISDANSTTVWVPAISNSADDAVLDDSVSGIVGIGLLNANALGIFTRSALYALAPTGNIPPFTRSYVGMYPTADGGSPAGLQPSFYAQSAPLSGPTPSGLAHVGYSNLWVGLEAPIGTKIWRYLSYQPDPPVVTQVTTPRIIWHHRLRALIVSTVAHTPPSDGFFYYNPIADGWGWQSSAFLPGGTDQALTFLGTGLGLPNWVHVVLDAAGNLWQEQAQPTPRSGIYVDTKDFGMPAQRYVDAIKVDWEPLTPGSGLKVYCLAREGINDGLGEPVYGTQGFEQNLTRLFQGVPACQQSLLGPGSSEIPLRARGKFIRFRFEAASGMVRIRGFAFRQTMASDRLTDSRIVVQPTNPAVWDHPAWNRANWTVL